MPFKNYGMGGLEPSCSFEREVNTVAVVRQCAGFATLEEEQRRFVLNGQMVCHAADPN